MAVPVVPHGHVAAKAQSELDQAQAEIADAEANLADVLRQLDALTQAQQERASALEAAFRVREDARQRCQQQRTFAELAEGTPAAADATATLATLLQALEQAELAYRTLAEGCDEQSKTANSAHEALLVQQCAFQASLATWQARRAELSQVYTEAHTREGQEVLASLTARVQAQQNTKAKAQAAIAKADALLAAIAEEAKTSLSAWPDLLIAYQAAFLPVDDERARLLRAAIAYRQELLGACQARRLDWAFDYPFHWFRPEDYEWSSPAQDMGRAIREMEAELAAHEEEARKQAR